MLSYLSTLIRDVGTKTKEELRTLIRERDLELEEDIYYILIYFKLAEITNGNELKNSKYGKKYRQKVIKLSNCVQATNDLKNPLFLAR